MASAQQKNATIKDVAKMAGVSVSTVSRYLNGGDHVSAEGKIRIESAIAHLNYRPSRAARALVNEIDDSLAVITGDALGNGPILTLSGIECAARKRGLLVSLTSARDASAAEMRHAVNVAVDQHPRGIILMYLDDLFENAAAQIPDTIPSVSVGGTSALKGTEISLCEARGAEMMTRYLLSLGHKTVYHIAAPWSGGKNPRLEGWTKALQDTGAPMPEPLQCTSWNPGQAREFGRTLALNSDVTAIFCGNDELAIGAIKGLRDIGRSVPDEVSVAGFDDHPLADFWDPSLTTIHQDFVKAGEIAVEMLVEGGTSFGEIDVTAVTSDHTCVEVPGRLVIRQSARALR